MHVIMLMMEVEVIEEVCTRGPMIGIMDATRVMLS